MSRTNTSLVKIKIINIEFLYFTVFFAMVQQNQVYREKPIAFNNKEYLIREYFLQFVY